MKRLILGLVAGGFLTFIGVESSHYHDKSVEPTKCRICVLGTQAARHVPSISPVIQTVHFWTRLTETQSAAPRVANRQESSARAPPLA